MKHVFRGGAGELGEYGQHYKAVKLPRWLVPPDRPNQRLNSVARGAITQRGMNIIQNGAIRIYHTARFHGLNIVGSRLNYADSVLRTRLYGTFERNR